MPWEIQYPAHLGVHGQQKHVDEVVDVVGSLEKSSSDEIHDPRVGIRLRDPGVQGALGNHVVRIVPIGPERGGEVHPWSNGLPCGIHGSHALGPIDFPISRLWHREVVAVVAVPGILARGVLWAGAASGEISRCRNGSSAMGLSDTRVAVGGDLVDVTASLVASGMLDGLIAIRAAVLLVVVRLVS